jgi:hypothetical protein
VPLRACLSHVRELLGARDGAVALSVVWSDDDADGDGGNDGGDAGEEPGQPGWRGAGTVGIVAGSCISVVMTS